MTSMAPIQKSNGSSDPEDLTKAAGHPAGQTCPEKLSLVDCGASQKLASPDFINNFFSNYKCSHAYNRKSGKL